MPNIHLITIGSELLKGRIINTNAAEIGKRLRSAGFNLSKTTVIPDTKDAILNAVESEMNEADIVIMSGGLGPTNDDITKKTLADLFGMELVFHEATFRHLERIFEKRKRLMTERNKEQAMLPETCIVLNNPKGTAPGMLFEKEGKALVSMPGVPFEMLHILEHEFIPYLQQKYSSGTYQHKIFRLMHIAESSAADKMQQLEKLLPREIEVAYLPRIDGLWLEFSINQFSQQVGGFSLWEEKIDEIRNWIGEAFSDHLYTDTENSLPKLTADALQKHHLSLAVAESITGGNISASLVSISGASNFLKGSVTAYQEEIKTQLLGVDAKIIDEKGVVSKEVAQQMASGVRKLLNADIGISSTGWADRSGDHRPEVWIGFDADWDQTAIHSHLYTDRNINIQRSSQYAMHLCLKKIREHFE